MTDDRFETVRTLVGEYVENNTDGTSLNRQALRRHVDQRMPGHDLELKSGGNSADLVVDGDLGIKLITDLNKYRTGNVGRQFKLHAESNDYLLVIGALDDTDQSTWSYLTNNYDARSLGLKALDYVASFARQATGESDGGHERPTIDTPKPALFATLALLLVVFGAVVVL